MPAVGAQDILYPLDVHEQTNETSINLKYF